MPASAGRPSPAAIAHPFQTATLFAVFDLVAFLGVSAWHGQLGIKALIIAIGSAVVVFAAVFLLLIAYRVAGD